MTIDIDVIVKDSKVWNADDILAQLRDISSENINLNSGVEGPCCKQSGLDEIIYKAISLYNLQPSQFVINSGNHLKSSDFHEQFNEKSTVYLYNLYSKKSRESRENRQWNNDKIFGMFIGRSNWQRLDIASYLYHYKNEMTVLQYHFDFKSEWHCNNFELEEFVLRNNDNESIDRICNFIKSLPIRDNEFAYPIQFNNIDDLTSKYKQIFVDIVCETFYSGKTFHFSEKVLRPILYKRPFIIQGSKYFLQNLKTIGFKTFDHWWDEGYDEDPWDFKSTAIKSIIDDISSQDLQTLQTWYKEMTPVLEHNYQVLQNLENTDWKKINNMLNVNCKNIDFT